MQFQNNHTNDQTCEIQCNPLQEAVFGIQHTENIKVAKLNGTSMSELLTKAPFKARVDAALELLTKEKSGKPSCSTLTGPARVEDIGDMNSDEDDTLSLGSAPKALPDPDGQFKKWVQYANALVDRFVRLALDPGSAGGVTEVIRQSPIGGLEGKARESYVGVVYEVAKAGEASARPHLRIANYRDEHALRMIKGSLAAAGGSTEMPPRHLFMIMDGKMHSHPDKILKHFTGTDGKALAKVRKQLYLQTSEESERATKQRMSGVGSLGTVEHLVLVSKATVDLPVKPHIKVPGTTSSDFLGPFARPPVADLWRVKQCEKTTLYGNAITLVSGRVEGDPGADEDPGPRPNTLVPFSWHTVPTEVYEELIHSFGLVGIWHLTACDPVLPLACIKNKKTYLGFGYTDAHVTALREEIVNRVFQAMQDVADPLYEKDLAELVQAVGGEDTTHPTTAQEKPVPKKDTKTGSKEKCKTVPKGKATHTSLLERLQQLDDGDDEEGDDIGA